MFVIDKNKSFHFPNRHGILRFLRSNNIATENQMMNSPQCKNYNSKSSEKQRKWHRNVDGHSSD